MRLTFLGHASWQVQTAGKNLLIDPFLTGNPSAAAKADDLPCDFMLISHAHGDHIGDARTILGRTGALAIATNEIAVMLTEEGYKAHGMHIGGKRAFDFGTVKLTTAQHGSGIAGGFPCGFLIESEGKKVYYAGDTALTMDMQLLRDYWGPIDLALLPIGSNFTMDAADAVVATKFIAPKVCIPTHYDTWPAIAADTDAFRRDVEQACPATKVVLLKPGESFEL